MRRVFLSTVIGMVVVTLLVVTRRSSTDEKPAEGFAFTAGAVNAVLIQRDGATLAVYGRPEDSRASAEQVLLTHHRRDVVRSARPLIDAGAKVVAPAAEQELIASPGKFWDEFTKARFHDYAQQSTKILQNEIKVASWVKEGDVVRWRGLEFEVLDTPGYTRGAVSYLAQIAGKKVAFTGDLIHGDGQLFDLYSLQDKIDDANIRGYHGYASRLALLIPSLRKIAERKPDLIVPARGPIIRNPQQAIDKLIGRVQRIYQNYLSTNALNWYFKEKRMRICGERVLGKDADVALMSYSEHQKPPAWIVAEATSRLLISDKGTGFLLDCGYQRVIDLIQKMIADGKLKRIDGIFVTHCHDDHTDYVQKAAETFGCPVYALDTYEDVLANPGAYHLPALTTNAIKNLRVVKDGQALGWQEFQLTFRSYPGQMFHHGALLARKSAPKMESSRPVFFIGDSFSPSGIDDYCLLNRNLVNEDGGYLRCLKMLREFNGDYWLINEHIPFVFTFTDKELDYLENRYRERIAVLGELFPWDHPNFGIDEQWAVFYPYGVASKPGARVKLEVQLTNHSPKERSFTVTPRLPSGDRLVGQARTIELAAGKTDRVAFEIPAPARPGNYLVTADIDSQGMQFRDWIEALVTVQE